MAKIFSKKQINQLLELKKKFFSFAKPKYTKTTVFIKKRPLTSFVIVLGLLLIILIAGQLLQNRKPTATTKQPVKSVKVFAIGDAPKATFQAKIEKSGIVKIFAQTPGVVQSINVTEGDSVGKGQTLIVLSSNYQGGNAPAVQSQIAKKQYQNVLDTFDTQKDLIQKQRDIANKTDENADKLRDISRKSVDETNALIDANQSVLDQLKQSPTPDQSVINQLQGGINQLREGVRSIDYSSSNDNPPAKLSDLQKDIALKQLDLQEKGLGLSKEISKLQLSLAYINEATMYPASPFGGVVERVSVHVGQLVNPGTLLATVTSTDVYATAILTLPQNIAKILMQGEPSELMFGTRKVAIVPYYVSSQATDGQLHGVFYDIPEEYQDEVVDGEFVTINVPVAPVDTSAIDPFVPIDAVYQSQDADFVLIAKDHVAKTVQVKLGKVYGNYVEVISGITSGDQIILDRNVIAGDKITVH